MHKIIALAGIATMAAASQAQIYTNGFEDINANGMTYVNQSDGVGLTSAFQGNDTVFPAQAGPSTSYLGMNFNATTGASTISLWAKLPTLQVKDGDTMSFWTRTVDSPAFPDRLEVRASTTGNNSGSGSAAVGSYTNLLLTVNPTLTTSGYPNAWTKFDITFSGIGATLTSTDIAFRYFVTNGGPSGANSDYIGIDSLEVVPEPGTMAALGLGAAAFLRRRRKA